MNNPLSIGYNRQLQSHVPSLDKLSNANSASLTLISLQFDTFKYRIIYRGALLSLIILKLKSRASLATFSAIKSKIAATSGTDKDTHMRVQVHFVTFK